MAELAVLSLGSTRGWWADEEDEERRRLLSYSQTLRRYITLVDANRRDGLRRVRIGAHVEAIPTNAFTRFDSVVRMLWLGAWAIRRESISLIQAQDPILTGVPALLLGRVFRLPVNVCVYGPNAFDPHWRRAHWLNQILSPLGRFVLRRASGIQVDGRGTADSLVQSGIAADRIRIKPMVPSNLGLFFRLERHQDRGGRPTRLLFVGRLHGQKNLTMLAHVLSRVGMGVELVVVGDGPERRGFEKRLRHRGVAAQVRWLGQLARGTLFDAFREADIFVLCSYYEGFPRVLMEAAAAGLPIVTTAVSGSDEVVIDGETGFIVPIGDVAGFAERVTRLVAAPALRLRMGHAAREHISRMLETTPGDARQVSIWMECVASATLSHDKDGRS